MIQRKALLFNEACSLALSIAVTVGSPTGASAYPTATCWKVSGRKIGALRFTPVNLPIYEGKLFLVF
jgi:hypothetical protein